MLILTRRPGESILIDVPEDLDPTTPRVSPICRRAD